jgi:hypothetical protein
MTVNPTAKASCSLWLMSPRSAPVQNPPAQGGNVNGAHFTDNRIQEIESGTVLMTDEERAFLINDVYSFEECRYSLGELRAMDAKKLMNAAYFTWLDYSR